MRRSIEWSIYENPLESNELNLDEDNFDEPFDQQPDVKSIKDSGKWIYTPMGILPLPSTETIYNNFRAWMMTTNFDITKEDVDILDKVPGIEMLYVVSRYRAIVCLGTHKDFDDDNIKRQIEQILCNEINEVNNDNEISNTVLALKNKYIDNQILNWFIFVIPNGQVISYNSNNEEDIVYLKKRKFFKKLSKSINGAFYEAKKDANTNNE